MYREVNSEVYGCDPNSVAGRSKECYFHQTDSFLRMQLQWEELYVWLKTHVLHNIMSNINITHPKYGCKYQYIYRLEKITVNHAINVCLGESKS
jgi:hypothetical protein